MTSHLGKRIFAAQVSASRCEKIFFTFLSNESKGQGLTATKTVEKKRERRGDQCVPGCDNATQPQTHHQTEFRLRLNTLQTQKSASQQSSQLWFYRSIKYPL